MKRTFSASIAREDDWYVAQCLEVDVASQGETPDEALHNLEEALALHFAPPIATQPFEVRVIEEPYPLTQIRMLAVDMGVTDLSTRHDWYARGRVDDDDRDNLV